MEDTRKYFDYELAYEGYKKAVDLLNNGGIQAVVDNEEFEISDCGTIEDWLPNGYVPFYASGYNITIYINDSNFDVPNSKPNWCVSGEVDIYSYSGGDDNLFINSYDSLQDRINRLLEYARNNEYTLEDLYSEYDSLINTQNLIKDDFIKTRFVDLYDE